MMDNPSQQCPFCGMDARYYGEYHKREFYECAACGLISSDRSRLLAPEEERKRYTLHQYSEEDKKYIEYLDAAAVPALRFIGTQERGLDYGSGPARILEKLLTKRGYRCESYDPLFFIADITPPYDYIFSTEVFEHFNDVFAEITKVLSLLRTGGILAVMTQFYTGEKKFADWHYIRDETHLSFYRVETLQWMEKTFNMEIVYCDGKRVVIFRKMEPTLRNQL
jgi:hypothetical protein